MSVQLVTWGAHPAHGGTWVKLRAASKRRNAQRVREGWELVFVPKGETPATLPVGAQTITPEPSIHVVARTRCDHL